MLSSRKLVTKTKTSKNFGKGESSIARPVKHEDKISDFGDIIGHLRTGDLIALGGMSFHNSPNALVREIIRSNLTNLSLLVAPIANLAVDLLAGSGCIAEVYCCYVGFEKYGLAPAFRKAAETGELKVNWMDYASLIGSLRAAGEHLPYYPVSGLNGSDVQKRSRVFRQTKRPFCRQNTTVILPIEPNCSIIHCQSLNAHGDALYDGPSFLDQLLIRASKKSIVIADRMKESANRASSWIFRSSVDIVSVQPYSAHPHSSWGKYPVDWNHLAEYLALARKGKVDTYIDRYVRDDEESYISRVLRVRGKR